MLRDLNIKRTPPNRRSPISLSDYYIGRGLRLNPSLK